MAEFGLDFSCTGAKRKDMVTDFVKYPISILATKHKQIGVINLLVI